MDFEGLVRFRVWGFRVWGLTEFRGLGRLVSLFVSCSRASFWKGSVSELSHRMSSKGFSEQAFWPAVG